MQFGPVQTDAIGTGGIEMIEIRQQTGVDTQRNRLTVQGYRLLIFQRRIPRRRSPVQGDIFVQLVLDIATGPQNDNRIIAVNIDQIRRFHLLQQILYPTDDGNLQGPRDNGHMRGRPTIFQGQAD